jgi:hypothetical protein
MRGAIHELRFFDNWGEVDEKLENTPLEGCDTSSFNATASFPSAFHTRSFAPATAKWSPAEPPAAYSRAIMASKASVARPSTPAADNGFMRDGGGVRIVLRERDRRDQFCEVVHRDVFSQSARHR